MMERLDVKWGEFKSALWKTRLGTLVSTLQARVNQQNGPRDLLGEHEASARQRGEPAHYDRVQELRRQERRDHHDRWA